MPEPEKERERERERKSQERARDTVLRGESPPHPSLPGTLHPPPAGQAPSAPPARAAQIRPDSLLGRAIGFRMRSPLSFGLVLSLITFSPSEAIAFWVFVLFFRAPAVPSFLRILHSSSIDRLSVLFVSL